MEVHHMYLKSLKVTLTLTLVIYLFLFLKSTKKD